MSKISFDLIKKLRSKTGVGIKDCQEALESSNSDEEKAIDYLRTKGILKAQKRSTKEMTNGFIGSYVHNGQLGVLVELTCETDFVARNERFQQLAKELALHITASSPIYVSRESIPSDALEREKRIISEKLLAENKPADLIEKITEGQLQKFYEEVCLLDQLYVRDTSKRIRDLINEAVLAFGEKIEVGRFCRLVLGES